MPFQNAYEDARRAAAYDQMEFPGTYLLAFRDLPALLREHGRGHCALDFGCGTGRSTRFLQALGFTTIGIDIAAAMLARARHHDPHGDYRLIADGDFSSLPASAFDVVLAAFTFDNIPGRERKIALLAGLRSLLAPGGCLVNIVSTPEIYTHEWASFTTRNFPENQRAQSGDVVRIVTTDHPDDRPVEDILWSDAAYQDVYRASGLAPVRKCLPLARGDEPVTWQSETTLAPWAIYVLCPSAALAAYARCSIV
jgi:ubiquinone/menaquinone biosynthesis C-methylase UbiE